MIVKIATHAVVFIAGAAAGIWWGVEHPTQAQQIANAETGKSAEWRADLAKAKKEWLSKAPTTSPAELTNWISDQKVQADKDVKMSVNHMLNPADTTPNP